MHYFTDVVKISERRFFQTLKKYYFWSDVYFDEVFYLCALGVFYSLFHPGQPGVCVCVCVLVQRGHVLFQFALQTRDQVS